MVSVDVKHHVYFLFYKYNHISSVWLPEEDEGILQKDSDSRPVRLHNCNQPQDKIANTLSDHPLDCDLESDSSAANETILLFLWK